MNDLEQRLAGELGLVADDLSVPRLDPSGLARIGRREQVRRRSMAAGLFAAAVVVFVGLVAALPTPSGRPEPAPAPIDGTSLPWWQDGVLHVDDRELEVPGLLRLVHHGATTLVAEDGGRDGLSWSVVHPDGLDHFRRLAGDPVLSADGRLVAARLTDGMVTVQTFDGTAVYLGPRRPEDRPPPDWTVRAVDMSGRVLLADGSGEAHVIGGDGRIHRVRTADGEPVQVPLGMRAWPGGLSWIDSETSQAWFGSVTGQGRATPVGRTAFVHRAAWTAAGSAVAFADGRSLLVQYADGRADRRIRLAETPYPMGWEDEDHLVVALADGLDARRDYVGLARCDVPAGVCSPVVDGPSGPGLLLANLP